MRYPNILLSLCLLGLLSFPLQAQDSEDASVRSEAFFQHLKKSHVLNLGVGLLTNPNQFSFDILQGGSAAGNPTPAFNLSYEYGLTKQIGVGALIGYYRVDAQQEFRLQDLGTIVDDPVCLAACLLPINPVSSCECGTQEARERVNVLTFAGKFTYHFIRLPKIDTYTNVTAGYSLNRRKTIVDETLALIAEQVAPKTKIPTFIYFVSAGIRYYITPDIAAFGEFGYGNVHLLQLGASYRW